MPQSNAFCFSLQKQNILSITAAPVNLLVVDSLNSSLTSFVNEKVWYSRLGDFAVQISSVARKYGHNKNFF